MCFNYKTRLDKSRLLTVEAVEVSLIMLSGSRVTCTIPMLLKIHYILYVHDVKGVFNAMLYH